MHGVDAAAVVVERCSVGIRSRSRYTTPGVAIILVTVRVGQRGSALGTGGVDTAARTRVQRNCVRSGKVDTLDNVNFSASRPVWSKKPECWPNAALASWPTVFVSELSDWERSFLHVSNVSNEQSMAISLVARDSYRSTAPTRRPLGSVVHSHVDLAIVGVGKSGTLSLALRLVIHKAVGWVIAGEEVEAVEEVAAVVRVDQSVACGSELAVGTIYLGGEGRGSSNAAEEADAHIEC